MQPFKTESLFSLVPVWKSPEILGIQFVVIEDTRVKLLWLLLIDIAFVASKQEVQFYKNYRFLYPYMNVFWICFQAFIEPKAYEKLVYRVGLEIGCGKIRYLKLGWFKSNFTNKVHGWLKHYGASKEINILHILIFFHFFQNFKAHF